jgi:hypothetical protein
VRGHQWQSGRRGQREGGSEALVLGLGLGRWEEDLMKLLVMAQRWMSVVMVRQGAFEFELEARR